MVSSLFIILGLLMAQDAKATNPDDFKNYLNYANSLKNSSMNALQGFNPQKNIPDYDPAPPASQHFQKEDAELKAEAVAQRTKDVAGNVVEKASHDRPIVPIDTNVPVINHAALIEDNADAIVRGQSNAAVDCHQQKQCETKMIEKTCHEQVREVLQQCTSIPKIVIRHESTIENKTYSGGLKPLSLYDWIFQLPENGVITHISVSIGYYGKDGPFLCKTRYDGTLNGYSIGIFGPIDCGHWFSSLSFNANVSVPVNAGQVNTVHYQPYVRAGWISYAYYTVSVNLTHDRKIADVTWQESCDGA